MDIPAETPADTRLVEARKRHYVFAVVVALLGGALGIVGAIVQEFQAGGLLLLPFIGAPLIEEAVKPVGVYVALIRWPQALRSRLFTALLAAGAGLVFGIIESIVYVNIYVKDPSDAFVTFRFTVTPALHLIASFIVGLGITYKVIDWAQGRSPLPKSSRNCYIAAVALHGLYNTVVVALTLSGVLDLD